jgi:cytochrome oxidase Cu insertion factor (SCO1/SenC/PrrC family)
VKSIFAFAIGAVCMAIAGCKSPEESCAECASATTSDVAEPSAFISEWLPATERQPLAGDMEFTAQDGRTVRFSDLKGAPIALSFIYTRCQNARKCPLVARTMARLQAELDRANVQPRPTLALITYDPEYDTPSRLDTFGRQFGFNPDTNALLLRPDANGKETLFKQLNVAVNFNSGGVNLHGIQLLLFDKNGWRVRTYRGLIWDNEQVLKDLKALAGEPNSNSLVKSRNVQGAAVR